MMLSSKHLWLQLIPSGVSNLANNISLIGGIHRLCISKDTHWPLILSSCCAMRASFLSWRQYRFLCCCSDRLLWLKENQLPAATHMTTCSTLASPFLEIMKSFSHISISHYSRRQVGYWWYFLNFMGHLFLVRDKHGCHGRQRNLYNRMVPHCV